MANCVDDWVIDRGNTGESLGLFEVAGVIRKREYDCLIELKPSWRTAAAGFASGVGMRIGTSRRFYSFLYNNRANVHRKGSGNHQTDLDLAMLRPLGIESSGLIPSLSLPQEYKILARELVGSAGDNYIVMHPGSGGSAPNWPREHYADLAGLILKSRVSMVVITGAEEPSGNFPGCLDLRGKTSLAQLSGIVAGAKLFVSGSTGPLHLADALGTPCVSFYLDHAAIGPTRWGPRHNLAYVLTPPGGPCRCRDLAKCRCLETITPQSAFNKVESMLEP